METYNNTYCDSKPPTDPSRSKKYRKYQTPRHRRASNTSEREITLPMEREVTPYTDHLVNDIGQPSDHHIGGIAAPETVYVEEDDLRTRNASRSPKHHSKKKKRKPKIPKIDVFLTDSDEDLAEEETIKIYGESYTTERQRKRKHKKRRQENLDEELLSQTSKDIRKRKSKKKRQQENLDEEKYSQTSQDVRRRKDGRHSRLDSVPEPRTDIAGNIQRIQVLPTSGDVEYPRYRSGSRQRDDSENTRYKDLVSDGVEYSRPRSKSSRRGQSREVEGEDTLNEVEMPSRLSKSNRRDRSMDIVNVKKKSRRSKSREVEIKDTVNEEEFPRRRRSKSKRRDQSTENEYKDTVNGEEKPKPRRSRKGKKPTTDTVVGYTGDLDVHSNQPERPAEERERKSRKDKTGKKKHKTEDGCDTGLMEGERLEKKKKRKSRKDRKAKKKSKRNKEHDVDRERNFNIVNGVIIPKLDFSSFLPPVPSPGDDISLVSYFSSEPEEYIVAWDTEITERETFGQKVKRRWRLFKRACMKCWCMEPTEEYGYPEIQ